MFGRIDPGQGPALDARHAGVEAAQIGRERRRVGGDPQHVGGPEEVPEVVGISPDGVLVAHLAQPREHGPAAILREWGWSEPLLGHTGSISVHMGGPRGSYRAESRPVLYRTARTQLGTPAADNMPAACEDLSWHRAARKGS